MPTGLAGATRLVFGQEDKARIREILRAVGSPERQYLLLVRA